MIKNCCIWILTLLLALRVCAAEESDVSRRFPVDQWAVSYGREHPSAPNRSLLENFAVDLFRAEDGSLMAAGTEMVIFDGSANTSSTIFIGTGAADTKSSARDSFPTLKEK